MTALTGRPTTAELVAAVADFLDHDVRGVDGQVGFYARVAANVLRIVERELLDDTADTVLAAITGLGADDEEALAQSIREGRLDDRPDEVMASLRTLVRHRLAIDHPGYAGDR